MISGDGWRGGGESGRTKTDMDEGKDEKIREPWLSFILRGIDCVSRKQ